MDLWRERERVEEERGVMGKMERKMERQRSMRKRNMLWEGDNRKEVRINKM